jgi:hypothetical protein
MENEVDKKVKTAWLTGNKSYRQNKITSNFQRGVCKLCTTAILSGLVVSCAAQKHQILSL